MFYDSFVKRILSATALSLPLLAQAAAITTLFDTGVGSSKAPLANGAADTHYTLVAPSIAISGLRSRRPRTATRFRRGSATTPCRPGSGRSAPLT